MLPVNVKPCGTLIAYDNRTEGIKFWLKKTIKINIWMHYEEIQKWSVKIPYLE